MEQRVLEFVIDYTGGQCQDVAINQVLRDSA